MADLAPNMFYGFQRALAVIPRFVAVTKFHCFQFARPGLRPTEMYIYQT